MDYMYITILIRACGQKERRRKKKGFPGKWLYLLHMALFWRVLKDVLYVLSISTAKPICARPTVQYISLAIKKNTIRYHPLLLTVIDQYATSFPSFPCLFPYAGPIVVALSRSIRASLSPLLAQHKRYSAPI